MPLDVVPEVKLHVSSAMMTILCTILCFPICLTGFQNGGLCQKQKYL